nr:GNAT family N-acetyltransferase [Virgibacillus salexigens]
MEKRQEETALESINKKSSNIFIAEEEGIYMGYIELNDTVDYFTRQRQGYISAIAVAKNSEGMGVGKRVMKKAEKWAQQKGYDQLVLHLFTANQRAMNFYKNLGYEQEFTVMVKQM